MRCCRFMICIKLHGGQRGWSWALSSSASESQRDPMADHAGGDITGGDTGNGKECCSNRAAGPANTVHEAHAVLFTVLCYADVPVKALSAALASSWGNAERLLLHRQVRKQEQG